MKLLADGGRRRRVAITGLPLFCEEVARQIRRLDPSWEPIVLQTRKHRQVLRALYTLATADVWYSIGSPVPDRWIYWLARLLRKPRVIHWVGSDIESLRSRPGLAPLVSAELVHHLAEADFTARELRQLGVPSQVVPLPPRHRAHTVPPLPSRFTVLLYLPKTRTDFYGRHEYERLLRRTHGESIRWLVVGGGSLTVPPGVDVENLGWRDGLEDIYKQITLLIRSTPRDGLSLMVLEALSFGRHVVWTKPFPHTRRMSSYDEMEYILRELLDQHKAGTLRPQAEAAELIREEYATDDCISDIAAVWKEAAENDSGVPRVIGEST